MSKHGEIRRYSLIIEKIIRGHYPGFREIEIICTNTDSVGDRTLQRDIEQIRYDFCIEIKYDRIKKGYCIDYENSLNLESFFHFLEIVNTAELLTESLMESKDTLKYISFDTGGGLKGIENLKPLLRAIKENLKIFFRHYNFQTDKTTEYTLKPYLLREYQNRWYVVGIVAGTKDLRIFGIDRILDLEVRTETFCPDTGLDPACLFDQTIGLIFHRIQCRMSSVFYPTQGKYVKTLPLHKSQQVLR